MYDARHEERRPTLDNVETRGSARGLEGAPPEVIFVQARAAHALLMKPDVRIAAVRLDDKPPGARGKQSRYGSSERVQVVHVVQDVDAKDEAGCKRLRGRHDVALLEADVRTRVGGVRVGDHRLVEIDAGEPDVGSPPGYRSQDVAAPAAEFEHLSTTREPRDLARNERDPPSV